MEKTRGCKFQDGERSRVFVDHRQAKASFGVEKIRQVCETETVEELMVFEAEDAVDFVLRKFTKQGNVAVVTVKDVFGALLAAGFWGMGRENSLRFRLTDTCFVAEIVDQAEGRVKLKGADVESVSKCGEDLSLESENPGYVRFVKFVGYPDVEQEGEEVCANPAFSQKRGLSVNFVELRSEGAVNVRTYERGTEVDSSITGVFVAAMGASFKYQPHKTAFSVNTPEGCFEVCFEKVKQGEYRNPELFGTLKMRFESEFSV